MTVRSRRTGATTVHAGPNTELAATADAYARGEHAIPHGYDADLFRRAAADLRGGVRVIDLGAVRFYCDRADGTPFHGPMAPEPDPAWLERQQAMGGRARA